MTDSLDLNGIIKREHEALAAETRLSHNPPFVAVNDMEVVTRVPSFLRHDHPSSVSALVGSKGEAFVVDCPSLNSTALWVGTENDDYRKDYLLYLRSNYKLNIDRIPEDLHVDHLYNRARARNYKLKYIRSALVDRPINTSHGASVEKAATKNEALRTPKDMKSMEELISMKYYGFLPPLRDDPRESEIAAYANFASMHLGLDAKEVRRSISNIINRVTTPWARKPGL